MFGYIVVNKPELKIKDFDTYQAFYCGLCRSLHKMFGRRSQITLNYDLTFLAILLSGLYEPKQSMHEERCIIHPTKKHKKLDNPYIAYASEMTVILTYLKCEDDWIDEKSYTSLTMMKLLKKKYQGLAHKYPDKVARIEKALADIHAYEKTNCCDIDALAKCFGIVMGEIVCMKSDEWQKCLYELGDYLGRFIYLLDAYDDIETDMKKGLFNPYLEICEQPDFDQRVYAMLEIMIAKCAEAFETLPILEYADILRNILYSGVWGKYEMIRKKRLGEKDARSI